MSGPAPGCDMVVTVTVGGESEDRPRAENDGLWGLDSFGRYATQVGIERMLDSFERLGVAATFFVSAWDAERSPELIASIAERGHEVAGHGYCHEDFSVLGEAEQAELLERSELAIERVAGRRPRGWRAPDGLMSEQTRPLLAARGYRYDSSFCDDIVAYVADETPPGGPRIVELPTFEACSDRHYYRLHRPAAAVLAAWRDELEAMSAAGGLFDLALNARNDVGSARGDRLRVVEELLEHALRQPGVRLWTGEQLAERAHSGITA